MIDKNIQKNLDDKTSLFIENIIKNTVFYFKNIIDYNNYIINLKNIKTDFLEYILKDIIK